MIDENQKTYIHNHLSIHLKFNKVVDPEDPNHSLYRVVGFTVIPHSIDASAYTTDADSCSITSYDSHQEIKSGINKIIFSYSGESRIKDQSFT